MKTKLLLIAISLISLIGCDDKNEEIHEYLLTLSGNTKDEFSRLGEERNYVVYFIATPSLNEEAAESLLISSNISIKTDNDAFTFSDYTITGNSINFNVSCKENQIENVINGKIRIIISNTQFSIEVSEPLVQSGSEIRHEYKIESNIPGTYTIPAEGGLYKIPLKCKRLTYINDNLASEEPYSLKGIRYVSNRANIAWGHFDRIYKQEAIGDYIIELIAEGPYNIEADYLWTVELRDDETPVYTLNILHTQTSGEEYYIGTTTNHETYLIDE